MIFLVANTQCDLEPAGGELFVSRFALCCELQGVNEEKVLRVAPYLFERSGRGGGGGGGGCVCVTSK